MISFSPNMLKTFEQCPRKYFLRYVENISAPQKTTIFEKGKKIHALAHYYLRGDDIDKLEKTLNEEEFKVWEVLKSNEYLGKTYVNSEYEIMCKLEDFWIGGRLDALVRDKNNYYILDYKTGAIPKDPEYDYQTMVYPLAVKKLYADAESITFVYIDLKQNKNHIIKLTPELQGKYTDKITKICRTIKESKNFEKTDCKNCEYTKIC